MCLISLSTQFCEAPLFTILHLVEEVKWLVGITQLAKEGGSRDREHKVSEGVACLVQVQCHEARAPNVCSLDIFLLLLLLFSLLIVLADIC